MMNYIDAHVIAFVDEWGDKVSPQLHDRTVHDSTKIFRKSKKCRMIQEALKDGKHIYTVGFKGCRGMIKKWLIDERGQMVRRKGRGIVDINPGVTTMAAVDIQVPFITSDEVFLVEYFKDRPYNLEFSLVEESMIQAGFDPRTDVAFFFFVFQEDIECTVRRFLDELGFIISREYLMAKGMMAIQDPKWIRYHASEDVADYTDHFFFAGINLYYSAREGHKKKLSQFNKKERSV